MAGPGLVATAVLLLLCWGTHQTDAQAPSVTITVSGSPPPGFTPGPDEYRAASGPFTFTCTATGGAGTGNYQYVWTTTCNIPTCVFDTSSIGATSVISRMALHSGDGGTHTCTATRGGMSGSDTITINIVGVGIVIFTPSTGPMPNNGLVISTNPGSGRRFFFECRSNSLTVGVGDFIGLDVSPIVGDTDFFRFRDTDRGGEISIENVVNSETLLLPSQQGVYTCRMPFEGGGEGEINIGVYPSGFNIVPSISNPLMFTPGSLSSTLACTSTGSVATTVTFMRGSTTVGPLRDGESRDVGGVTYQLTQTVTSRAGSTYLNVLTINQALSDIEDSTFTCSVENTIGTSSDSQAITVNAIDITSPAETPTVGGTATFTCTSLLGQADTIEWLLVDGTETSVVMNSGQTTLDLVLDPVSENMNGGVYRCRVTIGGATVDQDITVTVQVPTVSVMTSASGSAVAGEVYSITCAVMGADNLPGATFRVEWQRPGGGTLLMGTQSSLTHTFSPVGQGDTGEYTCEATITTDLLLLSPLTRTDMLDITVAVPDVTVLITSSGFAVVGMSYTLTCTVYGADNLEATIDPIGFTGPSTASGTGTSLLLPLGPLDLNDAGDYTCTATVSSGLLTNDIVLTDTEEVNIPIPSLSVDVQHDGGSTIYAGSMLTLICDIQVPSIPSNFRNGVTVTTSWLGASGNMLASGGRITVNPAAGSGVSYASTVVFNTVVTNNGGTFTCQATATHSSQFITDVTTPGEVTISPVDPTLALTVLPSTTRLPNVSPYNTFTLTCTATAPMGVVEPKTFTWRRTTASGGSCGSFGMVIESGTCQIANSNVNQPVSTSVLTVTLTIAAVWRYCCQASLLGVTGTSDGVAVTVTDPVQPQQPTNLMDIGTGDMSTMIRWMVPIIAYTPETYVVNYGTSMGSLDMTSAMVMSGSDFEAVNQVFSVALTGLVDTTTYFYQVVATNRQGRTSSDVQSFTATILRPGPPQNFTLTMRATSSLQFSWDPPAPREGVDAPTRYIVRCEPQLEGIDTSALVNQSATQLTATVMGLFPGVTYSCSVAAVNDQGEGDRAQQSGTTLETAPTGQPQNFDITPGESGPSSRELTFFWDLPLPTQRNGIITSYTISCSPDTETLPLVETTLPGVGGLTVGGVRPFTEYTCAIVATNSQGTGPPATDISMTNEDTPDGPPQSASFTTTGNPERLIFTVQPPQAGLANGVISSYRVRCIPTGAFPNAAGVNVMISSASEEVGGFTPAADYTCLFTASTSAGMGPETTTGPDVTTLPNAPTITSVTNQSAFEVLVEWTISVPDGLPGAITHFTVYVNNSAVENTADGTVLSYTISNLAPFQLVMVEVSASTSAGEGARSAVMSGRSSEASSGPVSNVVLDSPSASMVVVSWGPPQIPNGIILEYSVELERYEDGSEVDRQDVDGNTFVVEFDDSQNIVGEIPYNLTIFARNSAGEGRSVELTHFTEESTSPPPPTGVRVNRSIDGSSMTVSWIRLTIIQAGSFVTYIVTYVPFNSRRKRQSGATCTSSPCEVDGSLSSVMITGLDPGTSYFVQVATMNGGGAVGISSQIMVSQGIPPTLETDTSTSSGTDTAAIVGGVVAVVGLLILTGGAVMIVFLVLRHRSHRSSLSVEQHAESVKWSEVANPEIKTTECIAYSPVTHQPQNTEYEIPTAPCEAYGQSQQIPRVQEDAVYEIIPGEGNLPPGQI